MKRVMALILIAGGLAQGCKSLNPIPSLSSVTPEEKRIARLVAWHSGKVEVYKGFQTVYTARAVYLARGLKEAAADWEARSRLMAPDERTELVEKIVNKRPGNLEFLLGFYTPEFDQNVLEQDDAPWLTYLKYPSGKLARASCFGVGGDEQRIYQRFLKWDLSWSRLYVVCYPETPEALRGSDGKAHLIITGPGGTGEITLNLDPPPGR